MTNETLQSDSTESKTTPFGSRLKAARESLGFERKDVAAQLRLNEKIIIMMEKDRYPSDLPVTFIRGYLRAYAKLLQLPEYELKKALEPIKPKVVTASMSSSTLSPVNVTSGHYFMQFFTYLIMLTLVGLVGMWWYSHSTGSAPIVADNQLAITPLENLNTNTNASAQNVAPEETPLAVTPPAAPLPAPLAQQSTPTNPTLSENKIDTTANIANDTGTIAPKMAQAKRTPRAKRVVPVVEAEAQDLDSSENEPNYTETNS